MKISRQAIAKKPKLIRFDLIFDFYGFLLTLMVGNSAHSSTPLMAEKSVVVYCGRRRVCEAIKYNKEGNVGKGNVSQYNSLIEKTRIK